MGAALGARMATTLAGTVVDVRRRRRANMAGPARTAVDMAAIAIAVVTRLAAADTTEAVVETVASAPGVAAADTQAEAVVTPAEAAAGTPAEAGGVVDTPAAGAATMVAAVAATPAVVDPMMGAHITKHP